MTTYSWAAGVSGDWNTAADWAGGVIPNTGLDADVVIDAAPVTTNGTAEPYTVTISTGESISVGTIDLNIVNNFEGVNGSTYLGAYLEVDGTLNFAAGSAGAINGPLQSEMVVNNGTVQNAGTINAFVQGEGTVTFTGTNGIYFTNWLQSLGDVTIDTSSIAEYTVATKTLFDGIFEAKGNNDVINLGGSGGGLMVNIATVQGPGTDLPGTSISGWTELIFDGPTSEINEWNGTAYVPVESTITTLQNNATIDVNADPISLAPRSYTTTNTLSIGASSLFFEQGGTLTSGTITILSGGTLSGAPVVTANIINDGMILVSDGEMSLQGSVTGTGTLTFDSTIGTLAVSGVAAGETVALTGAESLILAVPTAFDATLTNTGTNTVTLVGVVANSATLTGGMLDIYNGTTLADAITMTGTAPAIGVRSSGGNTVLTFGLAAPAVTAGAAASYAAGAAPTPLDPTLTASDPDSTTLTEATVAISAGFLAGDTLSLSVPQAGITSSYDTATGVLTLSGSASVASYVAALDSVDYSGTGDPTDAGTDLSRTISWTIDDGNGLSATASSSLSVSFPSNAATDIMFESFGGQAALWQMNGPTLAGGGLVGPSAGPGWFAMTTGGFFAGGTSDIAWQNENGSVAIWQVSGTALVSGGLVAANPGDTWHIRGSGDFYNDGSTDLLWQNDTGEVALWDMSGTTIAQSGEIADPGPTWLVRGTGDFYGDGNDDILFQNANGGVALWDMVGTTIVQGGTVDSNPGPTWRIEGTGDFYGDGNTDILWQNDDGEVAIWDMKGTTIVNAGEIANPGTTWHVVGTGNFNADGYTDIVLQNDDGSVAIWEMDGTSIIGGAVVANPGSSWDILGSDTMRFISSGAAGETIAATPPAPDEFIFTDVAAGLHTITGFNTVQDIVELPGSQFASFTAVQAATTETAGGALINLSNGGSLLLAGVNASSLHASNFAVS